MNDPIRSTLIKLIRPHLGGSPGTVSGHWAERQARGIADELLAAGWRPTGSTKRFDPFRDPGPCWRNGCGQDQTGNGYCDQHASAADAAAEAKER